MVACWQVGRLNNEETTAWAVIGMQLCAGHLWKSCRESSTTIKTVSILRDRVIIAPQKEYVSCPFHTITENGHIAHDTRSEKCLY